MLRRHLPSSSSEPRAVHRLAVIELAGAPGAGKTTLLPTIMAMCDEAGLRPYTVAQAARIFAGRTVVGTLARHLTPTARRRALWAIYRVASAVGVIRLAARRPRMFARLVASQRRRPSGADTAQRRVLYWFLRTAGAYEFLVRHGAMDEALILDEGFVHRTVQLFSSPVERPGMDEIHAYLDMAPDTDLVVFVHAAVGTCQGRVQERGVWDRLRHRSPDEIDRFVAHAHEAIELTATCLRRLGRPVIDIDNDGQVADAVSELTTVLPPTLRALGVTQ